MTLRSQDYAHLANHCYGRDERGHPVDLKSLVGKPTVIGGVEYKVLAYADKPSGYQGVIYQRVDSGEIVVAHRGTEFARQRWQDLILTDGGMVLARTNRQAEDAIELVRHAMREAEKFAARQGGMPPEVTSTGHSLGGTLAQISAHHFGLKGETFNAYGAVSLGRRIPAGGRDVINHVMGHDLVGAGSAHYGQVRVYANRQTIDTLAESGYGNDHDPFDLRASLPAAIAALQRGSHDMHNFLPVDGQGRPDGAILDDPQARRLAAQYAPMIGKYRDDIAQARALITRGARGIPGSALDALDALRGPLPGGGAGTA